VDDWVFDDEWEWDDEDELEGLLYELAEGLADRFFLSDNEFLPNAGEAYELGYLEPEDWWTLVGQLDETVDLEAIIKLSDTLEPLLGLTGLPTEVLEAPLQFLESALEGNLPLEASGRRIGSRKLVKIALAVVRLVQELPDAAQAAVRAWADVQRSMIQPPPFDDGDSDDLVDLLFATDLPPVMTGFSMMIALTLMHWPQRAEGLPLPPGFADPALYGEVLAQWEALPDSPIVMQEGAGEAEALFAQGQLAHMLAQMGTVEVLALDETDEVEEEDVALAYSRLSRAILWMHNQCRHCPERHGVACKVATNWPERPVPLLDIASEISNTSRIMGCVKM
jgi:hypothetical protein